LQVVVFPCRGCSLTAVTQVGESLRANQILWVKQWSRYLLPSVPERSRGLSSAPQSCWICWFPRGYQPEGVYFSVITPHWGKGPLSCSPPLPRLITRFLSKLQACSNDRFGSESSQERRELGGRPCRKEYQAEVYSRCGQ
jgi:hypothetical protein